jgi:hypothetical protein
MSYYKEKTNLNDFEYVHLDEMATAEFTMSIMRLMDSVFETPDKDFEDYATCNYNLVESDPAELMDRAFKSIEDYNLTKYQNQFKQFAEVNTSTIFKWYRKNGASVNISPKQVEWFKRWFTKHNIGHEFLNKLDPSYNRSVKPNFGSTNQTDWKSLFGDKK